MSWYWNLTLAQVDAPPPPPPVESQPAAPQTTDDAGAPAGEGEPLPSAAPSMSIFWMLMLFIIIFWLIMSMTQRRDRRRHADLLAGLKKGDKVQTIGGVLGTVVEVRDAQVVLKVDENSNTRMHFTRDAIRTVLADPKSE